MSDYVDVLRVRIQSYPGGYPLPENLAEGVALDVNVDLPVDRRQLIEQLRHVLQRRSAPYSLHERYDETSWGAAGAALEIVIEVGATVLGTGIATAIAEVIRHLARAKDQVPVQDSETVVSQARTTLSGALGCQPEEVQVFATQRGGPGWEVDACSNGANYRVEVSTDGSVTFRRVQGPPSIRST